MGLETNRPGYKIFKKGKIYINKSNKSIIRPVADFEMPNFKAAEWEEIK